MNQQFIQTGATRFSGLSISETGTKVRVIPRAISGKIYRSTISTISLPQYEVETPTSTTYVSGEQDTAEGLNPIRALYDGSGLTWKELSLLFGVDPRAVQFWASDARKMSRQNELIANAANEILEQLRDLPKFKIAQFFKDRLLKQKVLLQGLRKGEAAEIIAAAKAMSEGRPKLPQISGSRLSSRIPQGLSFGALQSKVREVGATNEFRVPKLAGATNKPRKKRG